jgi:protein TonB
MTLLFEDEAARPIARMRPVPSAFFSLLVHASAVILLLWISVSPGAFEIPDNLRRTILVAPSPPPPPPPPPLAAVSRPVTRTVHSVPSKFTLPATKFLPRLVSAKETVLADEPPALEIGSAPAGISGGVPGGVPGGVIGGLPGGLPTFSAPPVTAAAVPVVKAVAAPPARIQVTSEVQEAMVLVMVRPEYPPLARRGRIQGTVRLSAIIDKEGRIAELKIVDGHPFLVDAALAVVRKWRYRPTLLGGEPVEVATQIIVHFRLDN